MSEQAAKLQKIDIDPILNDKEASQVLGTTSASIKQSRYTGQLFGRPAPKFLKMGRSAKYRLSTLLQFLAEFPEYQSTSEYRPEQETP